MVLRCVTRLPLHPMRIVAHQQVPCCRVVISNQSLTSTIGPVRKQVMIPLNKLV